MRRTSTLVALALLLSACGQQGEGQRTYDTGAPPPPTETPNDAVAVPQIAYAYGFSFTAPPERLPVLQARHTALCDRLGPACRVVAMEQSSGDRDTAAASLTLAVEARRARAFGDALVAAAASGGGKATARSVASEDLTKRIVDTEAHLRGRQALADRLLAIVRTRGGSVADLVAAEKALADVQEQIDAARSRLAEARGRVAMSTLDIAYVGEAGVGILRPVRAAAANAGAIVGTSLAALLTLVVAGLPWALLTGVVLLGWRRWRGRRRA